MGIIANLIKPKAERRDYMDSVLLGLGMSTRSGVRVDPDSAMTLSAVWACVRVIGESMASLPLFTYRRRADGGKERATDHPLYRLLHDSPNPEMTAFEFRELLASHVEMWGNGYADIDISSSGEPLALWPLNPSKIEGWERRSGKLFYKYKRPDNTEVMLPAHRVLHIRGLGGDGVMGYSPIRMHMEAIGLGLATQEFGARFFGNGANLGGILEHPGNLSAEAQGRLRQSFGADVGGLTNAHRIKILEEGMKYTRIGIPPEEAQFLETRKFQVSEIARIFRVPPHMIQDLDRATFSNIEHQSIDFVVHSLRPRLVRFEQAYQRQLLTDAEQRTLFVEHLVDGLLRGDIQSRYQAYNTGIQAGFLNRNEVRALENLNPAEDLDTYLVPLNMIEAGAPLPDPTPQDTQGGDSTANRSIDMAYVEKRAQSVAGDRRSIANAQEAVLLDSMTRIVRREVNDISRAVDKYLVRANDTTGFVLWLDEFYQGHREFIAKNMEGGFIALAGLVAASVNRELDTDINTQSLAAFVADYLDAMAARWADGNAAQLRAIIRDEDEPVEPLKERLDGWGDTEAQKNARNESFRAVNAIAYAAYAVVGVSFLRWVTSGSENCPYCAALNGRIVGRDKPFVDEGDFNPDGAKEPMKIRRSTKHAPLHAGCDCQVIASR